MSKPWDNEPTPITNCFAVEEYSPQLKLYADINVSRNLERRMRAAERLLEDIKFTFRGCNMPLINAHLEAAKEDGQ